MKIYGPVSDISYMKKIKEHILRLSLEESVFILDPVFEYDKKRGDFFKF